MNKLRVNKKQTGNKIYHALRKLGISYCTLAKILDLSSPRVVYEWVNGNKLPTIEHLITLAINLNIRLEDLLVIEEIL